MRLAMQAGGEKRLETYSKVDVISFAVQAMLQCLSKQSAWGLSAHELCKGPPDTTLSEHVRMSCAVAARHYKVSKRKLKRGIIHGPACKFGCPINCIYWVCSDILNYFITGKCFSDKRSRVRKFELQMFGHVSGVEIQKPSLSHGSWDSKSAICSNPDCPKDWVQAADDEQLYSCSDCEMAVYCCALCQKDHWYKEHKHVCRLVRVASWRALVRADFSDNDI
eukprot:TRINITY_DN72527_c0_g1_i1.p1 TRINITY_DN72527_c0_g1~~TRINITY_DN72527_c0_g1_i1.p1  ORF type:complete len:230 (+),score=16.76 TRINITY_DN72527_c0_g1_i1:26-691(+)